MRFSDSRDKLSHRFMEGQNHNGPTGLKPLLIAAGKTSTSPKAMGKGY